jgi:hypothetical protein
VMMMHDIVVIHGRIERIVSVPTRKSVVVKHTHRVRVHSPSVPQLESVVDLARLSAA